MLQYTESMESQRFILTILCLDITGISEFTYNEFNMQCCPRNYYPAIDCWRQTNPFNLLRSNPRGAGFSTWYLYILCPMIVLEECIKCLWKKILDLRSPLLWGLCLLLKYVLAGPEQCLRFNRTMEGRGKGALTWIYCCWFSPLVSMPPVLDTNRTKERDVCFFTSSE